MSEERTDVHKLKVEANKEVDFSAISPLEPLDPNKFRNIMLDKETHSLHTNEVSVMQQQKQEMAETMSVIPFATSAGTSQDKNQRRYKDAQIPLTHSSAQNQNFANIQQQMLPAQQNLSHQSQMQQQQYFTTQSGIQSITTQQYPMYYSGMAPATANKCGGPTVMPMAQSMQQQSQPYMVQGQQWVQQQQCHPMPQIYHNPQQGRIIASQQQNTPIKQLPQPAYILPENSAHLMQYTQHASSHNMQRQMSQEFNYQMQNQAHGVACNQPGFQPYGYMMDVRQQEIASPRIQTLNSPTLVKRPPPQNVAEHIHPQHTMTAHMGFNPRQRPQAHSALQQQQLQFFGHDQPLDSNICLAGCVFLIVDDYSPQLVDGTSLNNVIRFYGGDIESSNPRGIPERVTHIICSSWLDNEALIQQAVSNNIIDRMPGKMIRIVTINWLNDAIEKRRIEPPNKASHLPGYWSILKPNPQISSKIISIVGFNKKDMIPLKYMIRVIGARLCPITSKTDFLLLNNGSMSEQILQKAREFNFKLVNYNWLLDLYLGNINVLAATETQRFSPDNQNLLNGITISPHYLAKVSETCNKLMLSWSQPILISDVIIKSAYELKRNVMSDTNVFPEKALSISDDTPTEEQIKQASSLITVFAGKPLNISILIEGVLPEQYENLSRKIRFLGGKLTQSIDECTHFVTPNLRRSVNLLCAIALGINIITPFYIETSFKRLAFIDPLNFFVKDRENERKFGFNLKATTLRTRHRKIFQDVKFHISKNVIPSYETIKHFVVCAGGVIEHEKPTKKQLLKYIQNNQTYFVICARNDLNFYQFLIDCNFPLFNEDFVTMAILRHKIDLTNGFHAYPSLPVPNKS